MAEDGSHPVAKGLIGLQKCSDIKRSAASALKLRKTRKERWRKLHSNSRKNPNSTIV